MRTILIHVPASVCHTGICYSPGHGLMPAASGAALGDFPESRKYCLTQLAYTLWWPWPPDLVLKLNTRCLCTGICIQRWEQLPGNGLKNPYLFGVAGRYFLPSLEERWKIFVFLFWKNTEQCRMQNTVFALGGKHCLEGLNCLPYLQSEETCKAKEMLPVAPRTVLSSAKKSVSLCSVWR